MLRNEEQQEQKKYGNKFFKIPGPFMSNHELHEYECPFVILSQRDSFGITVCLEERAFLFISQYLQHALSSLLFSI